MYVRMTAIFQARRLEIVFDQVVTPGERYRARISHDTLGELLAECESRLASDLVMIESVEEVGEREPWGVESGF